MINHKLFDPNIFIRWHDQLGHLGDIMMRRIMKNLNGHPLKNQKIFLSNEFSYIACAQGKMITRPSPTKVEIESPSFLE